MTQVCWKRDNSDIKKQTTQKEYIMANTILKYKANKTKCAGDSFEIVKVDGGFQAIDALTGFPIGPVEKKKAFCDINIVNECKRSNLPFTRENTDFAN